jgi:beta-phosphoglucomutase-like phosphatase (HAD superfamily)
VTSDDVEYRKPAPDPYLKAMEMLLLTPASAIAIEDSQTGMRAATSAGLKVLAVRHAFNNGLDFSLAVRVLDSLLDTDVVLAAIRAIMTDHGG